MKSILTLLLLFIITAGKCCDCLQSLYKPFQESDFDQVDFIFLVEIGKETDPGIFEVKLIEEFKGEFRTTITIYNHDSCSSFVTTGEKWLIYTNLDNSHQAIMHQCSRSRDIEKMKFWVPPPPPPKNTRKAREKHQIANEKYLNSDRGDIEDELTQLREIRDSNH
jgi:hypothetical protein